MAGVLLPADLPVPIEVMVGKHLLISVGLIVRNGLITFKEQFLHFELFPRFRIIYFCHAAVAK